MAVYTAGKWENLERLMMVEKPVKSHQRYKDTAGKFVDKLYQKDAIKYRKDQEWRKGSDLKIRCKDYFGKTFKSSKRNGELKAMVTGDCPLGAGCQWKGHCEARLV